MQAQRGKSGFQVNVLGRIKAGDEMGYVCVSVGSSGIWHGCLKLLGLFGDSTQCVFAQVTAKGSEKEEKKGKVKGGEVSSFMSEQCQAGEERGMM